MWDFWLTQDEDKHHIFYLQAPRSLGNAELRHHRATIGHAVTTDFRSWHVERDALGPGPEGSWDDLAVWTGSVLYRRGVWHMLYTGVSRAEQGLVQRIGLATSTDLLTWRRHPANPVLEADPRWYEQLGQGRWRDQSWRDPFLFTVAGDDHVHVLITARLRDGAPDGAGVIAEARSIDLVDWKVLPPLTLPGEFAQVEVPQLVTIAGTRMVLFSCLAEDHSQARLDRLGPGCATAGTFVLVLDAHSGMYVPGDAPLVPPDDEVLYAGKIVTDSDGGLGFMAFRSEGPDGFIGELTDVLPTRFSTSAGLVVSAEVGRR